MSRIVIDVRSPAEYAARHIEGALNLDIRSAAFGISLAELPKDGEYVVYCGGGRRAGQARWRMLDAGFTDVTSYGILGAAAATGRTIVES
ncbi:MAG: rhodanese-like domain-containing protein [Actinomycetia bacterium]|nr:rhodanese-like domain-containing protein [Actinomycetes bacterium]